MARFGLYSWLEDSVSISMKKIAIFRRLSIPVSNTCSIPIDRYHNEQMKSNSFNCNQNTCNEYNETRIYLVPYNLIEILLGLNKLNFHSWPKPTSTVRTLYEWCIFHHIKWLNASQLASNASIVIRKHFSIIVDSTYTHIIWNFAVNEQSVCFNVAPHIHANLSYWLCNQWNELRDIVILDVITPTMFLCMLRRPFSLRRLQSAMANQIQPNLFPHSSMKIHRLVAMT